MSAQSRRRHRGSRSEQHAARPHSVNARDHFGPRSAGSGQRKAYQLCKQVRHTLEYVLSGECNDDVLRNVYVASVDPLPDASRLLVAVATWDPRDPTAPDVILTHLARVNGKLRAEVAAAIHRRKVPELVFQVVTPPVSADEPPLPPDAAPPG